MAVRREFGGEKQTSESSERPDPRNALHPRVSKPENIDTLVSRFLDELSGISSDMVQDGNSEAGSPQGASKSTALPQSGAADDGHRVSDSDLEKISEEIERSLAELERLSTGFDLQENNLVQEVQAKPEAELSPKAMPVEPPIAPPPVDPEEQAWNRLELFRDRVSTRKRIWRLSVGWVLACVAIVILGISAFFFWSSESGSPLGVSQVQTVEPGKPTQISGEIRLPVSTAASPKDIDLANGNRTAPPITPPVLETGRDRQAFGSTRGAETAGNRTPEASTAGQSLRRPTQNSDGAPPAERPKPNEESSRPAPAQAVISTTPASEPPSPAINLPAVSSPPKPEPVIPSSTTNSTGGSSSTAAVAASVPEVPLAAPKIAADAPADSGNEAVQLKPRVALMAEVLKRVQPVYPPIARSQRIGGKVEVEAEISEKGDVVRAKAISGPNLLRSAAEQALLKWKFKPASVDGVNVPSKARIIVTFSVQ